MMLRELSKDHWITLEALNLKMEERETIKLSGGALDGRVVDITKGSLALVIPISEVAPLSNPEINNFQDYYRQHPTSQIFEYRQKFARDEDCPI